MESKTYIKNIRISPRKLRILLGSVKPMKPDQTLPFLWYTPKKGARVLYQAIKSAIENAKQVLKVNESVLKFKLLTIEEGPSLKRFRAGGRGTAKAFKHRLSHIRIILEAGKEEGKKVEKAKMKKVSSEVK